MLLDAAEDLCDTIEARSSRQSIYTRLGDLCPVHDSSHFKPH